MPASVRYRTHDGTCNSRRRPRWGAAQMPFNRFMPPEYGDGVDSIRLSIEGGPLASSRFVSLLVHGARDGEAAVTLMTAQWGQLLDHDMTSTAQPRSINGSVPSCCGSTDFHPSCFPIKVPLDDPWLAPLKVRCLEFLRSAPAQRRDCILSWREQTNQATSYIDASPIYSNSAKSSDNARVFRNGLLVFGRGNPAEDVCQHGAIATQCIRAGDGRSGEQPGLLALHHVWVGEHNRIAMELSELNLHWSDEKIYQETRRIIGALFQHITYREFLPIVLGREVCRLFDLELVSNGYYQGYDPKTNPTVANSFAAAAFRFGHSLVQNSYKRCDRFHNFMQNNVSLHEEFQRGDIGSPGSLHRLIRGLVNQRALKRDEFITPELTNHLFQTPGFPFGLDLAAINIQRGRDHGVPPYTSWRVPCGLTPINSWEDFANVVGPQSAQRISHAYRSVHDIDLFVGGIAERPVVGGLVGPTFACIIAQQFSNSRKGDRFWYENGGFENSLTPAQLHSIKRVSLAQVLCRAVGGGTMQPHAFLPTDIKGNERQVCGTGALAPLDLSPWIEQNPFATVPTTPTDEPEDVFEIITTDKITETVPTDSVPVIKENKAGFPNRVRPTDHKNSATGNNGFVSGIQVPGEIIRINDKLDIRQKVTPVKRPTVTAKPIKGINNKLDRNPPKLTLNIRGVTVHRPQGTRRTTAVVNNIPIELRSATPDETEPNTATKTTTSKTKDNSQTNIESTTETLTLGKVEARTDDTDKEVGLSLNALSPTEEQKDFLKPAQFNGKVRENKADSNTTKMPSTLTAFGKTEATNELIEAKQENSSTTEDSTVIITERQSNIEIDKSDKAFLATTEQTSGLAKTEKDATHLDGDKSVDVENISNFKDAKKDLTTNAHATHRYEELQTNRDDENTAKSTLTSEKEDNELPKNADATHIDDKRGSNEGNRTTAETTLLAKVMSNELSSNAELTKTIDHTNQLAPRVQINRDNEESMRKAEEFLDIETLLPSTKLNKTTHFETIDVRIKDTTDSMESDTLAPTTGTVEMRPNEEQKRLQRRRLDDNRKLIVVKVPNWNNDTKSRFLTRANKTASFKKSTTEIPLFSLTNTRPTSRQVELRQYQTQPTFYTRPQKVVVNGPNTDQYEIEINIRQTNKQSTSALPIGASTNSYTNYATSYKPFGYNKYSPSYVGTYYSSTVPSYAFYPNTPAASSNVVQTRRTKPPTVIYINEHEDRYTTTTRSPGLIQNIISFASSGFGNMNKQPSPHSTTSQKERPLYGASVSSVHQNNHQIYAPPNTDTSAISHYVPRPASQQTGLPAFPAVPAAASLSQVGGLVSSGVVQATSSAISAGSFGTITGVAQANGADSTFSFNIRPKPSDVGQPQHPLPPNQINAGSYGLLPSRNPTYNQLPNPGFGNLPHSAASTGGHTYFTNSQKENANSPFSSENKRPQLATYGYYSQIQAAPLQKKTDQEHVLTISDYDELPISRTLERLMTKNVTHEANIAHDTETDEDDDDDDADYDYTDDILGVSEKFDRDGYMRPEHMINALIKSKENELKNLTANNNCTTKPLDDNYVLPVLSTTTDTLKNNNSLEPPKPNNDIVTTNMELVNATTELMTNLPDIEGKHLNNDILAESYEDDTNETLIASKAIAIKTLTDEKQDTKKPGMEHAKVKAILSEPIAFAPIKILTKLERPDNWVFYDSPKNYPLLPELPLMNVDSSAPADEIPMPIKGLASIWLKRIKNRKDINRAQFLATEPPKSIGAMFQEEAKGRSKSQAFTTVSP
ncbi:uncharacterized protein LOC128855362 [Anastrepha ludens]|uniref:uncharacterized protein LOC128855362 n=1 Tax=Anastrepha ludens TaxID=28586 RepID=UPI0023B16E84|nr:uncharacterized protein LOC128855362 [Anastrepha ludens]